MSPAKKKNAWTRRHLLGLEDLSADEITLVLDTAASLAEVGSRTVKKVPALRGQTIANLFFESSTRTANSFALAAKRLSADVLTVNVSTLSTSKGESLRDTARNIEAMGVDCLVVRHAIAGAPHLLARCLDCSVVNAGDGWHEHPTQGLLDIFTIRQARGRVEGLTVAIVGDIAHSRVARSNLWGLTKLGARVVVVGPSTLIPPWVRDFGAEISNDLDGILPRCDVVNLLRIQAERQAKNLFPSIREYAQFFGMNAARASRLKEGCLVMHPGPLNRGVEITPEVADGPHSVILRQVANGLAVRMAVLYLVIRARQIGRKTGSAPEGE